MGCIAWIISMLIGILIAAAIIHLAAYATGHADRGFGAAVSCAITQYLAGIFVVLPAVLFVGCFFSWWMGLIVWFLITVYIIQMIYGTSFGKAFLMWLVMSLVNGLYVLIVHGTEISDIVNQSGCSGGV